MSPTHDATAETLNLLFICFELVSYSCNEQMQVAQTGERLQEAQEAQGRGVQRA